MQINNENFSPFYEANAGNYSQAIASGTHLEYDDQIQDARLKHAINGRQFCTLEGLKANTDESVRWHAAVLVYVVTNP